MREQIASESGLKARKVLGYELSFYDAQGASYVGLREEFLASARLDNLLSCYIGLKALLDTSGDQAALLVCNDHEEGAIPRFRAGALVWCRQGQGHRPVHDDLGRQRPRRAS